MTMDTNFLLSNVKALQYCQNAHNSINQKRKYSGGPYWHHPNQVAGILHTAGERNADVMAAAYLHDVLEDVFPLNSYFSPDSIRRTFNDSVLHMVLELTDEYTHAKYPEHNRATRHTLEAQRLGKVSVDSMKIKLADLIANTSDILEADPGFAKVYIPEKRKVLQEFAPTIKAHSGNAILRKLYKQACDQIGEPIS